jgi:large conductance mechanosensitive channel
MKSFLKEFKDFIATGNLIELAVAFILAAAVKVVIDSFVNDIVMQLIAAIIGKPDFSDLTWGIGKAELEIGLFLNAVISLVLIGFVLFLIVKAYNRFKKTPEAATSAPPEIVLLTEIRDALVQRRDGV